MLYIMLHNFYVHTRTKLNRKMKNVNFKLKSGE